MAMMDNAHSESQLSSALNSVSGWMAPGSTSMAWANCVMNSVDDIKDGSGKDQAILNSTAVRAIRPSGGDYPAISRIREITAPCAAGVRSGKIGRHSTFSAVREATGRLPGAAEGRLR